MRIRSLFCTRILKRIAIVGLTSIGAVTIIYAGLKIFAAPIADEARVDENETLTYYITVNSDGIDHNGVQSTDSQLADETSDITKITDKIPDGLIFQGFVTSPDGTFGAVQRNDQTTTCAGKVIDDTNEESTDTGVWNEDTYTYTYHGLHYDAPTRTVSFRTQGITAGCELTVGVITKTPTLPEGVFRMDFYDHAVFTDGSLTGDSNTVHAWIQKDILPGEYSLSYRYDGVVPDNAPALPSTSYYNNFGETITKAPTPTLEGYDFDGWYVFINSSSPKVPLSALNTLPGKSVEAYGTWLYHGQPISPDDERIEKYDVTYEIEGEKPDSFNIPAKRSYLEGASVTLDPTKEGDNYDGYDFSGWNTDAVVLEGNIFEMPKNNITLRGSFEQQKYTVSYAFVGDTKPENADSLIPAETEHIVGDIIEIAPVPSADGYTFSGWYVDSSFEMPARDIVINGKWTKNKTPYAPSIGIEILNQQDEYHSGDIVEFKIDITNSSTVDLSNVWLSELLDGAYFTEGEGYTVNQASFAKINSIPANSTASVFAEFQVTKNLDKTYTNTVELIALDFDDSDYTLPESWENEVSVDFITTIIDSLPVDDDPEPIPTEKSEVPITLDGIFKTIGSFVIITVSFGFCVFYAKQNRRNKSAYGVCAITIVASGLLVVWINGGHIMADSLVETPELDIYSSKLNFENEEAGSWNVHQSARWTGVGLATLDIDVYSKKISDLHNRDVIMVLDNSNWTNYSIDGTEPDNSNDKRVIEIMRDGASEFVTDLLGSNDSRIIIMPTWGDNDAEMTSDTDEALRQIGTIEPTTNSSINSYSESYSKILNYLDYYEQSNDRALNIVFVSEEHYAMSDEIAKYNMIKAKAPNAIVSAIGLGNMEVMNTKYWGAKDAANDNVVRWSGGIDGNLYPSGRYIYFSEGLDAISDLNGNPWASEYVSTLSSFVDSSLIYDKFNIETLINTDDFEIRGIYSNVGDIDINENNISWKNEDSKGLVSGAHYSMNIVLKAKDESVSEHKLYQLNRSTIVSTEASDIEADSVTINRGIVLVNGYKLSFNINNTGNCNLGNNTNGGIYLAYQRMALDEENIYCEGWNFDTFKDPANGNIYSSHNDAMPSHDVTLTATWRKVDAEVHMDGKIHTVAPAILMSGKEFNAKANIIAQNADLLRRADGCPSVYMDEAHRISADDSPTKIYAWHSVSYNIYDDDPDTGAENSYSYSKVMMYCSNADTIRLNEDSSYMFSTTSYRDENDNYVYMNSTFRLIDDSIADWDTSMVKNMDSMFVLTSLGDATFKKIKTWDTSKVESMRYTFAKTSALHEMTSISDWDTSSVTDMTGTFSGLEYTENVNVLKKWDTSNVRTMESIFASSSSRSWDPIIDLSGISDWDTSNVTNMKEAFASCTFNLDDIKKWDVSSVESFEGTFRSARLNSNGTSGSAKSLENWDVSAASNLSRMFDRSNLSDMSGLASWNISNAEKLDYIFSETEIASTAGLEEWKPMNVTSMKGIFAEDNNLSNLDALSNWGIYTTKLTDLSHAFRGISADNLVALSGWDTSNVETLAYAFCGATYENFIDVYDAHCDEMYLGKNGKRRQSAYGGVKSLTGLENWNVQNVKDMDFMLAGNISNDLTPISGWNVSSVKNMRATFSKLNVQNFEALRNWQPSSLEVMERTFEASNAKNLSGLDGWGSHVKNLTEMSDTFHSMLNLENIEALSTWETDSLTIMTGVFKDHKKLTSLHGLENWNVSNVMYFDYNFVGFSDLTNSYDNWSRSSRTDSKLTDISALSNWQVNNGIRFDRMFAANELLEDYTPLANWRLDNVYSLMGMFEGNEKATKLDGIGDWFNNDRANESEIDFDKTFANMTKLNDISALSNWTNATVKPKSIRKFMVNDFRISNITILNNTFLNKEYSSNQKTSAFDSVPNKTSLDANFL